MFILLYGARLQVWRQMLNAAPGGVIEVGVGCGDTRRRCCGTYNACGTNNGTVWATVTTDVVSNTADGAAADGVYNGGTYGGATTANLINQQCVVRPATRYTYGVDVRASASDYGGDNVGVLRRGVRCSAD